MPESPIASRVGFIGAGQMARALAQGWVQQNLLPSSSITAYDVSANSLGEFIRRVPGAQAVDSNRTVVRSCALIVVAVKPQSVAEALVQVSGEFTEQHLVISIAAGIPLAELAEQIAPARLIRVMPNSPCLIAKGASAFSRGANATTADAQRVQRLLEAVGYCTEVPEAWLDAITAVSGSGPAFVLLFLEGLIDGAVQMGIPRDIAIRLAAHTMEGTAAMVLHEETHPAILRDRVASPAGTTMAGLFALERGAVRGAAMAAIQAATQRAHELRQIASREHPAL